MTEADIVTHSFRPEIGAHVRLTAVMLVRSLTRWPTLAVFGAVGTALVLIVNQQALHRREYDALLIQIGVVTGLLITLFAICGIVHAWWTLRHGRLLISDRRARLTDRSLVVEGPGLFSELTWNNFCAYEMTKRHIILYLTLDQALMIPISAFDNRELADNFFCRAADLMTQSAHSQAAVFETPVTPAPEPAEFQSQPYLCTIPLYIRVFTSAYLDSPWPKSALGSGVLAWIIVWPFRENLGEFGQFVVWPVLIFYSVGLVGMYLVMPLAYLALSCVGRVHASLVGPCVASIQNDHLILHGEFFHTELQLGDLRGVRWTGKLILFVLQSRLAEGIPVSAFETPKAARAFFDEASTRWKAARPKPAAKTQLDGKS